VTISSEHDDGATVRFTPDQAIVLFELLSRWSDDKGEAETPSPGCFENSAEGAVLNGLLCALEKQLVAPFREDWGHILSEARARLASCWNYPTLRG
jgi:hypothetical protein